MSDFWTCPNHVQDKCPGRVVSRGQYCGESLLVCWKHEWIIMLLNELGCADEEGCPSYWDENEFDTIVSMRYALRREGERGFAWDINATVGAQNFVMPDDLDGWFTPSAMIWILAVWSAVLTVAMVVWYSRRTTNWDHSAAPRKRRNRNRVAEPL